MVSPQSMPGNRTNRAVATAVCLALGGTALLTWAFSVFTEDKSKKRPGKAPTPVPQNFTPVRSESASLLGRDETSGDGCSVASVLTAEQLAGLGQEGPALIIENKAALEPPNGQASGRQSPITDGAQKEQGPVLEAAVSPETANFFQNVPAFEDKYSSSLVRTPIADAIVSEQLNTTSSKPGPIEQQISQLDTKVTTYEERQPDTHEMVADGEGHVTSGHIPLSVSSKSLESAVMYAPSHKTKSKSGNC